LVGLAKWSILGPVAKGRDAQDQFSLIHLFVLECLAEVVDHKSALVPI
jgi:hypothetical protein